MKRKRGCPVELQHGACGIWLDASALKKRKVQAVMPLRVLNRQAPYFPLTRSPHPCTKQTTISTFFSVLQAGDESAGTRQRLPAVASSGAPLHEDHGLPQELCSPPPASALAQSDTSGEGASLDKAALAEGKGLLSSDCAQEKGLLGHPKAASSPLRERNAGQGFWCSKNQQLFLHAAVQAERRGGPLPSSDDCLTEAAELENVDPRLKGRTEVRGSKEPLAGPCWRPQLEGLCKSSYEAGQWESQAEPPAPLFSQDSEGRTVISHRFARGGRRRGRLLLPRQPLRNRSSLPGTGLSESSQQPHYDALFTEDSEGNRVIKH